jgi:hypothetical protein
MISRWSSLFKSANAIPRPFSLLRRISVSPATSTKVPLVRPFLIPHLHDWRKMEVCLMTISISYVVIGRGIIAFFFNSKQKVSDIFEM